MTEITKHCADCGTDKIVFDANSRWDPVTQSWVYIETTLFDEAYCPDCMDAVGVEDREVPD